MEWTDGDVCTQLFVPLIHTVSNGNYSLCRMHLLKYVWQLVMRLLTDAGQRNVFEYTA